MNIPGKINQGDSVSWNESSSRDNLGNTIDSSWALTYYLRGPSDFSKVASANGDGWTVSLDTTDTAGLTAGIYYWQAVAVSGSSRVTLGQGRVEIIKNLALVIGTHDGRSQIRKDLEAVQAAMRALIQGGVQEYTIGNRTFKKTSLAELREMESKLKFDLNKEERAEKIRNGLGDPFTMKVRF